VERMIYSTMRKLLLPAVFALAGCSTGGASPVDLIQPDVRVHHLALRNVGLAGGTLDVVMAFHNPNRISLKGTSMSAGLDIEGNRFGDVALTNPFSLAGRDTTLLTLPLTFRWSGLASAARSVLNYGAVNYAINGKFTITTPVGAPLDVPFSGQGNVPLLRP
jgi:LEA14-like dessication related protein